MNEAPSVAYDPDVLDDALERWRTSPIDPAEKGFTNLDGVTAEQLVANRARVPGEVLTLPLMVIRDSALSSNVTTMASWCRDHLVELAPHGKTSMSPQLTARQLRAGAWGITAATIQQVRAYADQGVRRILLANQLVDPAGIAWLARAMNAEPALTVIGYVDSLATVGILEHELTAAGATRPLPVVVELGLTGFRTGARSLEVAVEVARATAASDRLDLVGASGYEGVLGHGRSDADLAKVAGFCRQVRTLGLRLVEEQLLAGELSAGGSEPILTAGGSTYFDIVARELVGPEPATVVLRSGGALTHDDGLYATATPLPAGGRPYALEPALEAWAYVISRPEPELALIGAGKRDIPYDVAMPTPRGAYAPDGTPRDVSGVTVTHLNDQHGFLSVPPDCDLVVGDRMSFGIAHPCTAFDKWRLIPIVDGRDRVVEIAYTLF